MSAPPHQGPPRAPAPPLRVDAEVVASRPEPGAVRLTLEARELAGRAAPGQFVSVAVPGSPLRRPFWIAGTGAGTVDLVVRAVGPGSAWLAARMAGERVDVLGPLGRPAPLPAGGGALLVGPPGPGPLGFLAQALRHRGVAASRVPPAALEGAPASPGPDAGDGGAAAPGVVYAAGAPADSAAVAAAAARRGLACHAAVTPPMACGTGVCWGCAVPVVDGPPVRACLDGPLLDAARVDWAALAAATPPPAASAPLPEDRVDLAVDLGPLRLANPVLAASGTAGSGLDLARLVAARRLGAIVAKSVTLHPRAGRPGPRTAETTGGMLNAIGLQNPGVEAWLADTLPLLDGLPVIASVAGETVEEYGAVAERLRGASGLLAIEANISCPNVEDRGRVFACRPQATRDAVAAVVARTDLPVFAKLTADVTDITETAAAALDGGATGLTVANTLLGLAIDAETFRPRLGGGTGGLSGPAVKPVALRAVLQVARAFPTVPIVGVGGVRTAADVVEFVLAGATAVAVGTATLADPAAGLALVDALPHWLATRGHRSITALRGAVRL
jgi:dihydroorotate dehydrogenase (NAD+) catalytic subunit